MLDGDVKIMPCGALVLGVQDKQQAAAEDDAVTGELKAVAVYGRDELCGIAAVGAGDAAGYGELADDLHFEPERVIGADGQIERECGKGRWGCGLVAGRVAGRGAGCLFCALFSHDRGDAVSGIAKQRTGGEEIVLQAFAPLGRIIAENLVGQLGDDQIAAFALGEGGNDGALAGATHPEARVRALAKHAVAGFKEAGLKDGVVAKLAQRINV